MVLALLKPKTILHRRRYHTGSSLWSRYYVSQQVYNSSQQVHHAINTSRTTFSRPTGALWLFPQ
jgi:uncharacterized membrane protein